MKGYHILLIISIIFTGCQDKPAKSKQGYAEGRNIISKHGMVVSSHPQGSAIGVSILQEGGNAVDAAVATTLNNIYGSSIVVDGAGFLLNNEMNDFSVKPGVPNMFGLTGGTANSIVPGKRMLSSMTPTIVEKDGKLFLVAGSPGGSTIPTSVFQVIINVIDHNMSIMEAVDTGRFHHQWLPDWISYEINSIDSLTLQELKQMGHETGPRPAIGRVNAIQVLPGGVLAGGADKRGDNTACGY